MYRTAIASLGLLLAALAAPTPDAKAAEWKSLKAGGNDAAHVHNVNHRLRYAYRHYYRPGYGHYYRHYYRPYYGHRRYYSPSSGYYHHHHDHGHFGIQTPWFRFHIH